MAQSVETTQEIQLEDIVEMSAALSAVTASKSSADSSVELGDDDLLEQQEAPVAINAINAIKAAALPPVVVDSEDLVSTRVQPSRMVTLGSSVSSTVSTAVMATLRVPSLTLAQAMSALAPKAGSSATTDKARAETTQRRRLTRLTRLTRWSGQLPAPIWASLSAAVAALVVGSAALAATHSSDDSVSVQVRVAEREEPQSASKAMRRKYATSEQLGRWSEVPTYVADVSVSALPKR